MSYYVNKAVWVVANPISLGLAVLLLGLLFGRRQKLRSGCMLFAIAWFYLLSTPFATNFLGAPLERDYLVDGRMQDAERYPTADAIVDFGGGVGECAFGKYAELTQASDRAYFAAALWKAGRAPIIVPSGGGMRQTDVKFLLDLGVPAAAIVAEEAAQNTEQNAKFVARLLNGRKTGQASAPSRPRVLLVTSAWHMKRSMLMMRKYAPELDVTPAPCDFESTQFVHGGFSWSWLKPDATVFWLNSVCAHEWLGYWGYRILR